MSRYSLPSAKPSALLKDNSWIKKPDDEDEDVDRDPNFGKSILGRYRSNENLDSSEPEETTAKPTNTKSTSSSVHALTKRFSGSQDELRTSSTLPTSKTTSPKPKSTYSSLKSPTTPTTPTVTKGSTTPETTPTPTQAVRSPVVKSPTKTDTFTERVLKSSNKGSYAPISPTKTPKVTETTAPSNKDAEDKLFDTLIPSSIKEEYSPTDSKKPVFTTQTVTVKKSSADTDAEDKLFDTLIPSSIKDDYSPTDSKRTISSTEYVTVKSSPNGDSITTTTTTKTSSTAQDDLYDTLLPEGIKSPISSTSTSIKKREVITVESSRGGDSPTLSSPVSTRRTPSYSSYTEDTPSTRTSSYTISTLPSDDYSSDRKSYSYSRPDSSYEYSSVTSPSVYTSTSYRSSSRSDDSLADPIYSKSSTNVYAAPERPVLEKDLCSSCRKPFTGDAKMVLDDIKINCHASCFKCDVCNCTLHNMKAGDILWVYKRMVHCENCFERTREKWRR